MGRKLIQLITAISYSTLIATSSLHAIVGVDFTLSLDTGVDPGTNYTDLKKAGAGTADSFVIGFNVDITAVDGVSIDLPKIAAFCSEIGQDISATSYTFSLDPLNTIAASIAGNAGTASSNIPIGGIGDLRAARLSYLFDQYYISNDLTAWTHTTATPSLHAFQLAVWEVTHDDDLSLAPGGEIALPSQPITLRENARTLANTWLSAVDSANLDTSYTSSQFTFWALTDPTKQDIILAFETGSPEEIAFSGVIPEPSETILLSGLLALGIVSLRKKLRS